MSIELRCNNCLAVFDESESLIEEDFELCPFCYHDSLFEREAEEEFSDDALIAALNKMEHKHA